MIVTRNVYIEYLWVGDFKLYLVGAILKETRIHSLRLYLLDADACLFHIVSREHESFLDALNFFPTDG